MSERGNFKNIIGYEAMIFQNEPRILRNVFNGYSNFSLVSFFCLNVENTLYGIEKERSVFMSIKVERWQQGQTAKPLE